MKSHLTEEQLCRWIAGERTSDEERHARDCARCSAEVRQTEMALQLFRDSAYRRSEGWHKEPFTKRPSITARLAIATAMAVLVLTIAFALRKPATSRQPEQRTFVQIPYVIPPAPYERTKIVRMDIPVAALIAAGLRVDVVGPANSVRADVLLAQDGRPLAVSLISNRRDE